MHLWIVEIEDETVVATLGIGIAEDESIFLEIAETVLSGIDVG